MGAAEHYRAQRESVTDLFAGLTQEQLATGVPGCPKWTVRDVLGHMVGVTASVCSGAMDNAGSPEWTQAQMDERRDRSVAELLEEWGKRAVGFEEALPGMGFMGSIFVMDLSMHQDDVREALGLPLGSLQADAFTLEHLVTQAGKRAPEQGSLMLSASGQSWTLGGGEPTASLTVSDAGELSRVLGGRRSNDQILALDWSGDSQPWLPALPLFKHES